MHCHEFDNHELAADLDQEIGNAERAAYGLAAIQHGAPDKSDYQTMLVDALANIRHYAYKRGLNWSEALREAGMHFAAEVHEASTVTEDERREPHDYGPLDSIEHVAEAAHELGLD